jgi:hypothetical protein
MGDPTARIPSVAMRSSQPPDVSAELPQFADAVAREAIDVRAPLAEATQAWTADGRSDRPYAVGAQATTPASTRGYRQPPSLKERGQ